MGSDTFEVIKRDDGKWDFKYTHSNGNQIFSTNQGYENKADCIEVMNNTIQSIKNGCYNIKGI